MELTTRLSTLTQAQRLQIVEKIFLRLSTAFGNQWMLKWQGVDMKAVYADWAEDLTPFSVGAIKHAIEQSRLEKMPPNLGEFVKLCGSYQPVDGTLKLKRKFSDDEINANKARIETIKNMLAGKMTHAMGTGE